MKTRETIKHPQGQLVLMARTLRQDTSFWRLAPTKTKDYREVKRSQLAKLFQLKPQYGVREMAIDSHLSDREWATFRWMAEYEAGVLNIGCVEFTKSQSAKIRRWALRK